ncbi:MAG: LysM peptidoglycan-binding domain-containing protein [Saprospiraceae bacterium]|nr:LysM peptidoglycan-binding domain-containing protein [Lewinella sp.]
MRLILLLQLFFCVTAQGAITGDSLHYLNPGDTVFLMSNDFGDKYLLHQMEPKQTLYSLAKFYGLTVGGLYYSNPGLRDASIRVGQVIRVPIPNRAIRRYQGDGFNPIEYVPVFYRVKRGDTMYRIAKTYFRMPVEELAARNQLMETGLKTGQLLHVGWMNIHGIQEDTRSGGGGPAAQHNQAMKEQYLGECQGREYEESGVAHWVNGNETAGLYALHRRARQNGIISVTNPMNNRTIYVKVIGNMSDRAYEDNIKVVLSPMAARLLGAVDPRFFVKVTYCR